MKYTFLVGILSFIDSSQTLSQVYLLVLITKKYQGIAGFVLISIFTNRHALISRRYKLTLHFIFSCFLGTVKPRFFSSDEL